MDTLSSPPMLPRSRTTPSLAQTRRPSEHRQPRRKISNHHGRPSGEMSEPMQIDNHGNSVSQRKAAIDLSDADDHIIELFGERLDRWHAKRTLPSENQYNAAADLVKTYRKIAGEEVKRLKEKHTEDCKSNARNYWQRQLRADTNLANNGLNLPLQSDDVDADALESIARWQAEYDTWRLFEDLISARHPEAGLTSSSTTTPPLADYGNDKFAADGETFRQFVMNDLPIRERLVICKWLEECADNSDHSVEILEEELENYSKRGKALWTSGWMDTRERIKAEKRLRIWNTSLDGLPSIKGSDGQLIVQQLDPDAASRLQRSVDAQDESFEMAFWMICLELLRQGRSMDELRSHCERCNQQAIAVLLGAAFDYSKEADDENNVVARFRWRKACRSAAAQKYNAVNRFQAAVLGLLGGDSSVATSTCADWKAMCHLIVSAQIVQAYQRHVKQCFAPMLPPDQLHNFSEGDISKKPVSLEETVATIVNDRSIRSKTSTSDSFSMIQMALISNSLTRTLYEQGSSIARQVLEENGHGHNPRFIFTDQVNVSSKPKGMKALHQEATALRVLAHMFIILEYLKVEYSSGSEHHEQHQMAENICAAYAEYLLVVDKWLLIPQYASHLSPRLAGHVMAKTMPLMLTDSQREGCIKIMQECQMDVVSILGQHTQYSLQDLREDSTELSGTGVAELKLLESKSDSMWPGKQIKLPAESVPSQQDDAAIASGQWYLFAEGHWMETFEALLEIAETFLILGKAATAIAVAQGLSPSLFSKTKTPYYLGEDVDVFEEDLEPESVAVELRQQALMYTHCVQLIDAISAMFDWRVAEEQYVRNSSDQNVLKARRDQAARAISELKRCMDPVLAQGFLMLPDEDPQRLFAGPDPARLYQVHSQRLQSIREANLPELVIAYNSALCCAGHLVSRDNFIESLELGKAVSENDELIRCFQKAQRMRELVDALALTSKAMLSLNESKPPSSKQRGKTSRTLGIWDIRV